MSTTPGVRRGAPPSHEWCVVSDESSASDHWFEPIAEHLDSAYLRYSFTKGTRQEIDFLLEVLDLRPGSRVLDVGCGPGRHALELARRGFTVHGVDISAPFVRLAREAAAAEGLSNVTFDRHDARDLLSLGIGEFDAAICLCQGAFGLMRTPAEDRRVLTEVAASVQVGGRLALSAFNAYFSVAYHDGATFDADLGVSHERTMVKSPTGVDREVDLWTGCFTPRELRLLADRTGWDVDEIWSVDPGAYRREVPSTESSEFLVLATRRPVPSPP